MTKRKITNLVALLVESTIGQTIVLVLTIALFILSAAAPNATIGIGK